MEEQPVPKMPSDRQSAHIAAYRWLLDALEAKYSKRVDYGFACEDLAFAISVSFPAPQPPFSFTVEWPATEQAPAGQSLNQHIERNASRDEFLLSLSIALDQHSKGAVA